jgi:hypothetical protein
MTHNRSILFAVAVAAALMASAQAFARGAAPSPEAFSQYVIEGRNSAFLPYGYTDTTREGMVHAN